MNRLPIRIVIISQVEIVNVYILQSGFCVDSAEVFETLHRYVFCIM